MLKPIHQKPKVPQQDLNLKLICRDCRDSVPNIIEDFVAGDLICGNCGLVLGNRVIDTRSEWRTFANSDDSSGDPSRVGAVADELLIGNSRLESTMISGLDNMTGVSRDLNRVQSKISQDRTIQYLSDAFRSLQHMADAISLPKIVTDSAKQLFKRVDEEKLLKGKSSEAIKAACLYIACKQNNSTRTFKEICNLSKVSKKEIGKCFKILQPHLEQPHVEANYNAHINRYCSQLNLTHDIVRGTMRLCEKVAQKDMLAGRSPITIVAACLYFVSCLSENGCTSKDIADTCQCTESTLKNAYRILYEQRIELIEGLGMKLDASHLPS